MNAGVLQFDSLTRTRAMWSPSITFERLSGGAEPIGHHAGGSINSASFLSAKQQTVDARHVAVLATPLIQKIRQFADPVVHGGKVIAAGASPLVRQEAAQQVLYFAEVGLTLVEHADQVVMPSVHQAPSGAVQFEWHRRGIDLEIAVLPSGRITAYVESQQGSRELDLAGGTAQIQADLYKVLAR